MNSSAPSNDRRGILTLVAFSFFGWGVLRSLTDVLVAALQAQNPMHDARAMLVHSSFFMAYLVIPFASALLIRRRGFRVGLIASTGLMAVAALLCAAGIEDGPLGPLGLAAIFLTAAGIAGLQTAGNPAITLLGEPQTRARRLFAVQCMSSFGASVGPLAVATISAQRRLSPIVMLRGVRGAYAVVGMAMLLLTLGLIWSDRVNPRILRVCCCRWFRRFPRTERAAVGAVFSDD